MKTNTHFSEQSQAKLAKCLWEQKIFEQKSRRKMKHTYCVQSAVSASLSDFTGGLELLTAFHTSPNLLKLSL
jgi:hypothetical protein